MSVAVAVDRLCAVRPQWVGIVSAGQAIGLGADELLHAGPPLRDPTRPPPVLMSSAVMTLLHDGRAADAAAAEALVRDGAVRLSPAQPRGCVLPLAFVASATTPMCSVVDATQPHAACFAPLTTLRGFDTRMGTRDPALRSRLEQRDRQFAPRLGRLLDAHGPVPLWPLAVAGLAAGDDLHSRTTGANANLAGWCRAAGAGDLADDIEATPLFFLTLWMAACSVMLAAADGVDGDRLVVRAGGNGESFGVAVAASPRQWVTTDATPPLGRRLQGGDGLEVCGAIGDSAVVDMLGLGAQRLALAPEPRQAFSGFVPDALEGRAEALLVAPHPLIAPPWPVGLDARRVAASRQTPLVALAMLASDGRNGFVGRGVYQPPVELFERASA